MIKDIHHLEKILHLEFKNFQLLVNALTHRSYLNEHPQSQQSNERLEFLGDAILELIVSDFLYEKFPHLPEGKLTSLRSRLVCTTSLASISRKLNLGDYLFLSKGEMASSGLENESIFANTFEALVGAIYKDQGLSATKNFIQKQLLQTAQEILYTPNLTDFKSQFQEISQREFKITPIYRLLKATGPDHEKTFSMKVYVGKKEWGIGQGKNKQEAEQAAACKALENFGQSGYNTTP